jgi:hypothetical protein
MPAHCRPAEQMSLRRTARLLSRPAQRSTSQTSIRPSARSPVPAA